MLAGGAVAALQLIPPPDAITGGLIMRYTPNAFPSALAAAFFPTMVNPLTIAAGALIVIAAIVAIRRDRGALLILLGTLAGLAYLFTYKWIGGLRHTAHPNQADDLSFFGRRVHVCKYTQRKSQRR